MKFGALWIDKALIDLPINIGNELQHFYSIIQLLLEMGIAKEDIIPIKNSERSELPLMDEHIIHPMNELLYGKGSDRQYELLFPLPKHMIMVALGLSFYGSGNTLYAEAVEYLKKYEPIGARDEYTVQLLRNNNIESYLYGCISLTQPKRPSLGNYNTIYANDLPDGFIEYIPDEIRKELVFESQIFPKENQFDNDPKRRYHLAESVIARWRDTAKLVICSKLHVALPCLGMGIPVIFAADNHSSRFGWIDKHLKIYTRNMWSQIDWNPQSIDLECIKSLMRTEAKNAIMAAIMGKQRDTALLKEIDAYWMDRQRPVRYDNFAYDVILSQLADFPDEFAYLIWGVGLIGEQAYQAMQILHPNANFICGIDSFTKGVFHEKEILTPIESLNYADAFIIAATYTGRVFVQDFMKEHGKQYGKDYILLSSTQG